MSEAASHEGHAVHVHAAPTGFIRKYIFSLDHKVIGIQYTMTALALMAVGCGQGHQDQSPFVGVQDGGQGPRPRREVRLRSQDEAGRGHCGTAPTTAP